MRVVHQVRDGDRPHAEPLCGDWGGMDTAWTDAPDGVTCPACLVLLRASRSRAVAAERERAVVARRGAERW